MNRQAWTISPEREGLAIEVTISRGGDGPVIRDIDVSKVYIGELNASDLGDLIKAWRSDRGIIVRRVF